MSDVVVLGTDGQLGQCVKSFGRDWTYLTPEELDLSDAENVRLFFSEERPRVILNLAAYTAVDKAEEETDLAIAINGESSEALAKACQFYFYISTDYVFNGLSDSAYVEDHPTDPINAYGQSKLLGEKAALESNDNSFIIRTSWLYSEYGHNFLKSMLKLSKEKDHLKIVNDQLGSPTYAKDLAEVLIRMVDEVDKHPPGIYHFSNSGKCTWFEFAKEIFKLANINIEVEGIPTEEYPTPAKRPRFSVLDTSKISKELHLQIPDWKDALKRCLKEI